MGFRHTSMFGGAAVAALAIVASALYTTPAFSADVVKVRYSWKLKGEYAPFYLGVRKGMYEAKGLDVRLGEGAGAPAALGSLVQGQEDLVVLPGIFALSAIQKNLPAKLIAVYHPATPVGIISQPDKPILTPRDLEGKTIAHSVGETGTSYLQAFCALNDVDCGKIKKIQMDSQARVPQFIQKQVDAVSVYLNNDLPVVEDKTGQTYPVLNLAEFGLRAPGLSIVASEDGIKKRGEVLKRFLAATDEAIRATVADPKAAAAALSESWPGGPSAAVVLRQVEETVKAIKTEPGKPYGWMDANAIDGALRLLKSNNEVDRPNPAPTFFTNDLLPR